MHYNFKKFKITSKLVKYSDIKCQKILDWWGYGYYWCIMSSFASKNSRCFECYAFDFKYKDVDLKIERKWYWKKMVEIVYLKMCYRFVKNMIWVFLIWML